MKPQESRIDAATVLEHLDWVRGLARGLVRDASLADDVTQEAWLAALRRPAAEGVVSRSWLAQVVRNIVRQEHRRAAIRTEHEERTVSRDETASTDELVARVHTQRMVVDAVLALDAPYRRVILLRYFEGLAPRAIARRQGIPVATVKTRLRRGLEQLRRALDRRHGGDREAWMSAVTALGASAGRGVETGTLVIGAMAMGTVLKVSAGALVAAACVYLVARSPQTESPQMATVETPMEAVELPEPIDSTVTLLAEDRAAEAERRNPIAENPPGAVDTVAGANVLRVILEGITEGDAQMARVTLTGADEHDEWPAEIRGSWLCQGLTSEFDLDPFLASLAKWNDDPHVDELEVEVDHPLHLTERKRASLSHGARQESGRTVYEIRVRLEPAAVIHGRLVRANDAPAGEGLVGALLLEETAFGRQASNGSTVSDVPINSEGRAVECGADGAFELRVPASGRYALASYEEGQRPTTTHVDALVGTRVDVGTLVLEPGHAITGHALRHGNPMAGASISLTPPRVFWAADPVDVARGMDAWIRNARTFNTRTRSVTLAWLGSRFELMVQRADVDENGAFAFGGLAPCEYRLRVAELDGSHFLPSGWDNPALGEEGPDETVVRAPAHGVVLEFNWTSIRFELQGDLRSEDEGRLVLRTKSLYRGNEDIHIPEFWATQLLLSGDEPTFVLQAPPTTRILGEVTFPDRQPVSLDFQTPESGREVVIPVELVRAEEAATLVIELENPQAEIPEAFTVMLWRVGMDDAVPDTRPVAVAEGLLRVEDVVPGHYHIRVSAGRDPNHPGLFLENELDLELLPGLVATQSIRMQQGAGLRVTLRDEDGELLSGKYELYDHSGSRVSLCLVVRDRWKPGSDRWATLSEIHPYGINESSSPLQPGLYRLVLLSPGYANRSLAVELRAGEYADVDVTLSR